MRSRISSRALGKGMLRIWLVRCVSPAPPLPKNFKNSLKQIWPASVRRASASLPECRGESSPWGLERPVRTGPVPCTGKNASGSQLCGARRAVVIVVNLVHQMQKVSVIHHNIEFEQDGAQFMVTEGARVCAGADMPGKGQSPPIWRPAARSSNPECRRPTGLERSNTRGCEFALSVSARLSSILMSFHLQKEESTRAVSADPPAPRRSPTPPFDQSCATHCARARAAQKAWTPRPPPLAGTAF